MSNENLETGVGSVDAFVDVKEYSGSDFDSEIDLVAEGPTGHPARGIMVLDAGGGSTLEIVTAAGNTRPLTGALYVGKQLVAAVRKITANTDMGTILVGW